MCLRRSGCLAPIRIAFCHSVLFAAGSAELALSPHAHALILTRQGTEVQLTPGGVALRHRCKLAGVGGGSKGTRGASLVPANRNPADSFSKSHLWIVNLDYEP
jgi:hypothetical protein